MAAVTLAFITISTIFAVAAASLTPENAVVEIKPIGQGHFVKQKILR